MSQTPLDFRLASPADAIAIAALHTQSWRTAYRGILPDHLLDGALADEQQAMWQARLAAPTENELWVCLAQSEEGLLGFVCVLADIEPAFGARIENLHVLPGLKGRGIGGELFARARNWIAARRPGNGMHLWVLAQNAPARAFYERQGGRAAQESFWRLDSGEEIPEIRYCWGSGDIQAVSGRG